MDVLPIVGHKDCFVQLPCGLVTWKGARMRRSRAGEELQMTGVVVETRGRQQSLVSCGGFMCVVPSSSLSDPDPDGKVTFSCFPSES